MRGHSRGWLGILAKERESLCWERLRDNKQLRHWVRLHMPKHIDWWGRRHARHSSGAVADRARPDGVVPKGIEVCRRANGM